MLIDKVAVSQEDYNLLQIRALQKAKALRIHSFSETEPNTFLGPHLENGSVVIRAYLPDAHKAWITTGDQVMLMKRLDDTQLFEIQTGKSELPEYKIGFSRHLNPIARQIANVWWDMSDYHLEQYCEQGKLHTHFKNRFQAALDSQFNLINDPYRFSTHITSEDLWLWSEGTHLKSYEVFGARIKTINGVSGAHFAVWAPNAQSVSVIGDFNSWKHGIHPLSKINSSGVWAVFIPELKEGDLYKFAIKHNGKVYEKIDPFALHYEFRPKTASVIADIKGYEWQDHNWLKKRETFDKNHSPLSVYEVHLGSWARVNRFVTPEGFLNYKDLAHNLVNYVKNKGYTHVELLPVAEHPFDGSWGYQGTGYFAPTSRHGTPKDFMYFVDYLHQNNIGVILDWVPGHFAKDMHALNMFDGTQIFSYPDERIGVHKQWGTNVFDYGRGEVRSFLLSNAIFWRDEYHIDALRVDAVASMIYLDYNRGGEDRKGIDWIPNVYGGKEHLQAIHFLQRLNKEVHKDSPGFFTVAEESTAWKGVTKPVEEGGLGFDLKWNMGWMHDILRFFSKDPIHRQYHLDELVHTLSFAYKENYILPISHDEVVHLKKSLFEKMPGNDWDKFANLRLFLSFMYTYPGKKLLFMGNDFAQRSEWNYDESMDWQLLDYSGGHRAIGDLVSDLNKLYQCKPALHSLDNNPLGFELLSVDKRSTVVSYLRQYSKSTFSNPGKPAIVICNFTPVSRTNYSVPIPYQYESTSFKEVFNSDHERYGGTGTVNKMGIKPRFMKWYEIENDNYPLCLKVTLPPLGVAIFELEELQ